jgi:hypothetical protein
MRITSGGNVGIGTTTPGGKLDIAAGTGANILISADATNLVSINNYSSASGFQDLKFVGANQLFFTGTAGGGSVTERMRITSGGNVGIGTTPNANYILDVLASKDVRFKGATNYMSLVLDNSSTTGGGGIYFKNNGTTGGGIGNSGWWLGDTSNDLFLVSDTSKNIRFAVNGGTEAMRITSGGQVVVTAGISSSAASGATNLTLYSTTSTAFSSSLYCLNSSSTNCMFVRGDGYGYLLASAWAYGSDLRMKENISDVNNGIDMVLKMKPKHFDYIGGQKDNIGFIAQDIQEIIPQAVSISDETTGMLALKTDFLVPYLVKAIQELKAELDTLKNK